MDTLLPAWTAPYQTAFTALEYPLLLTDQTLALLWANPCAEKLFPRLAADGGLRSRLSAELFSTLFDKFQQNQTVRLPCHPLFPQFELSLAPVRWEGRFAGCTVSFQRLRGPDGPLPHEGAERVLALFTHQTRNPISSIFAALTGIANCNETLESPELREYTGRIATQAYRLLRTSVNIAELGRYEHGSGSYAPKYQDFRQFLEQFCRVVSLLIEGVGIGFRTSLPEGPVLTSFDPDRISVVLLHLVSNAAKFIAERGEIRVGLSCSESALAVSVTDNGLGIPAPLQPQVFDPFYSRDPRTEGICGDGLGLTICKLVVEQHGGSITLESREGEGTRVAFSLPVVEGGEVLVVNDLPGVYLNNRFSDMRVLLSDVCPPPDLAIGYRT